MYSRQESDAILTQFGVAYIRSLLSGELCDLIMRADAGSICSCLEIQLVSRRDSQVLINWGNLGFKPERKIA